MLNFEKKAGQEAFWASRRTAPSKLVYIGAEGAFGKFLGSINKNVYWKIVLSFISEIDGWFPVNWILVLNSWNALVSPLAIFVETLD